MSKSATTNNTTKRYDGEGTVNQRKDGRWEYRVSLGKVNGKYAYKSFYAATERELKKLIKQYNSAVQIRRHFGSMPSIGCVFISFQTYAATQSTAWKQLTRYISNQS